jgi:Mg2+ and Co2+ transporter CorA
MKAEIGDRVALINNKSEIVAQGQLTNILKNGWSEQRFTIDDSEFSISYSERDELILIPESEVIEAYTQSQKDFSDLVDKMFQYSVRDLSPSQLTDVMDHFDSIFEILKPYETERSRSLQSLWGNHHYTFEDIQKKNLDFKELKRKYA